MLASVSLRDLLSQYAVEHGLAPRSAAALGYGVSSLERAIGHVATVADLDPDTINLWLVELLAVVSCHSAASYRRGLLTLWRAAAEIGLTTGPCRVRKIKAPVALPVAWGMDELRRLLSAADGVQGSVKGVRRADFWRAWILIGYETGFRFGDLLALRSDQIGDDGFLAITQSKTGQSVLCRLSPAAMQAAAKIAGKTLLFAGLLTRRPIQVQFAKLVRGAGLQGSTKWLRRSGATWCEVHQPGSAMAFLGHRTPGLAYKHYVDPRFVQRDKPRPPKIG